MIGKFINMWIHPWASMNELAAEGEDTPLMPSIIFMAAMGLLSGAITTVLGFITPPPVLDQLGLPKWAVVFALVIVPALYVIANFVNGVFIWGILAGFLEGTLGKFKTACRLLAATVAFYPVSTALAAVPKAGQYLALAVNVWALIVVVQGVIIVFKTRPVRTWLTFVGIFILLLLMGVAIVGNQAQMRNNRALSDFESNLGPTDDLTEESDELDAQLKSLATDAKKDKDKPASAPTTK